jgi:hypothetical protein
MSVTEKIKGVFSRASGSDEWEELRNNILADNGESTEEIIDDRVSGEDLQNSKRNEEGVRIWKTFIKRGEREFEKTEELHSKLKNKFSEIETWMSSLGSQLETADDVPKVENLMRNGIRKLNELDNSEEKFQKHLEDAERYFKAAKMIADADGVKAGYEYNGINLEERSNKLVDFESKIENEREDIENLEGFLVREDDELKDRLEEAEENRQGEQLMARQKDIIDEITESVKVFIQENIDTSD